MPTQGNAPGVRVEAKTLGGRQVAQPSPLRRIMPSTVMYAWGGGVAGSQIAPLEPPAELGGRWGVQRGECLMVDLNSKDCGQMEVVNMLPQSDR
jgi:hypothetical protein